MASMPPAETQANARDTRVLFLNNTDHGGTTVQLTASQTRVRVETGAAGDIGVYLPSIDQVQDGAIYSIYHVTAAANNCVVDDGLADAFIAFTAITMTTAGDYAVLQRTGDHWTRLTEKVGGTVAPL